MRFARHIRQPFEKYIKPRFAGLPIRYLEVGVFDTLCLTWMFNNVLTNPDSVADVVGIEATSASIAKQELNDRCNIHSIPYNDCASIGELSYDMIFIDGSDDYDTVLQAGQSLCRLVAPRGMMIFDDYHIPNVAKAVMQFAVTYGEEHRCTTSYETRCQRCLQIW